MGATHVAGGAVEIVSARADDSVDGEHESEREGENNVEMRRLSHRGVHGRKADVPCNMGP